MNGFELIQYFKHIRDLEILDFRYGSFYLMFLGGKDKDGLSLRDKIDLPSLSKDVLKVQIDTNNVAYYLAVNNAFPEHLLFYSVLTMDDGSGKPIAPAYVQGMDIREIPVGFYKPKFLEIEGVMYNLLHKATVENYFPEQLFSEENLKNEKYGKEILSAAEKCGKVPENLKLE